MSDQGWDFWKSVLPILVPTLAALAALYQTVQTHKRVNARMDKVVADMNVATDVKVEASLARGVVIGRQQLEAEQAKIAQGKLEAEKSVASAHREAQIP